MGFHRLTWRIVINSLVCLGSILGCADIEKYQKPEREQPRYPVPETHSVELRLTPEERAETQAFAAALEAARDTFDSARDTLHLLTVLDSLAALAEIRWRELPDTSGAQGFYVVANADMLNQIFVLRRAIGDEFGMRKAQRRLLELKPHLPQ